MAIQIKHAFTSLKGDGGDATLIRPSNWNALHTTSMATQNLLGRLTAGAGVFEEIPLTTFMASFLAATDYATLAGLLGIFETGDVKPTFRTTASPGWLKLAGGNLQANTIGNAASGAVLRNNADTLPLFTIIWDGCTNTEAPIYDSAGSASTRGANAAADFAANKRLAIPNGVGKAIIGAGAANSAGLITTARVLGVQLGEEGHALTAGENGPHIHAVFLNDPGHVHGGGQASSQNGFGGTNSGFTVSWGGGANNTNSNTTGITVRDTAGGGGTANQTASQGSGTAHNTMQPSLALNLMVKL